VTRRAELNDWLTRTLRPAFAGRILPVTEDIPLKWRTLMEDGRKTGHTYSHPDLVIAATALHYVNLAHDAQPRKCHSSGPGRAVGCCRFHSAYADRRTGTNRISTRWSNAPAILRSIASE
jgi:hypothetical protein